VPGAIPPLMGWTAATNHLALGGWIAFAILFFWQLPHFMALSWIYREDYHDAGFFMSSASAARQAVLFSLALLAASVAPSFIGMSGIAYAIGAVICGVMMIAMSIRFFFDRTNRTAMRLFMTSNMYLIVVMTLLVVSVRA